MAFNRAKRRTAGADPENVEPGGANCINYQSEPGRGAQIFFLVLHIRANRGRAPGAPPSKSAPAQNLSDSIMRHGDVNDGTKATSNPENRVSGESHPCS